jgi:hypothetical protein
VFEQRRAADQRDGKGEQTRPTISAMEKQD